MNTQILNPHLTINEIVSDQPAALAVLQRFGIDACCGGALTLAEAAARQGVTEAEVLDAIALATED
jgi:regulator of cell morphogenesis and NO signaling